MKIANRIMTKIIAFICETILILYEIMRYSQRQSLTVRLYFKEPGPEPRLT
jgi:hypothetical protein